MRYLVCVLTVAVLTACGGQADEGADPSASVATDPPTSAAEPAATATTAHDEGETVGSEIVGSGGRVTIDSARYGFVPDVQCSFFPGGVVSIAGSAAGEPDSEIVFDVFEGDNAKLRVNVGGTEWTADGDAIDLTVENERATGMADVSSIAGDTARATFDLYCE